LAALSREPPVVFGRGGVAPQSINLAQVIKRLDRIGRSIRRPLEELDRLIPTLAAHGQSAQVETNIRVIRVPALGLAPAALRLCGRTLLKIGQTL